MKDYFELISARQSCRNYAEKTVDRELLVKCVQAARLAPSACNSQPWSFVVVAGRDTAAALAKCCQSLGMNRFTDAAPAFIAVVEEKANLSEAAGARYKKQEFANIDLGLAVSQLVCEAQQLGLASCILGWFDESAAKQLLGIDDSKRLRMIVSVGYAAADDKLREKKRKPLEQIMKVID